MFRKRSRRQLQELDRQIFLQTSKQSLTYSADCTNDRRMWCVLMQLISTRTDCSRTRVHTAMLLIARNSTVIPSLCLAGKSTRALGSDQVKPAGW